MRKKRAGLLVTCFSLLVAAGAAGYIAQSPAVQARHRTKAMGQRAARAMASSREHEFAPFAGNYPDPWPAGITLPEGALAQAWNTFNTGSAANTSRNSNWMLLVKKTPAELGAYLAPQFATGWTVTENGATAEGDATGATPTYRLSAYAAPTLSDGRTGYSLFTLETYASQDWAPYTLVYVWYSAKD